MANAEALERMEKIDTPLLSGAAVLLSRDLYAKDRPATEMPCPACIDT
jgi:hypothetical protein